MQRNRNLASISPSSDPYMNTEPITSYWYDSKATSNLSFNSKSEKENDYSKNQPINSYKGSMASLEEKRQPLQPRNLNEPLKQNNTNWPQTKMLGTHGKGQENRQPNSKDQSYSDRYEKKLSNANDRQNKFQKLGLITPSPSPPKSLNEPQSQENSGVFSARYGNNDDDGCNQSTRSRFPTNPKPQLLAQTKPKPYQFNDNADFEEFPNSSRQIGANSLTERGRTTILQPRQPAGNFLKRTGSNQHNTPRSFSKSGSQDPVQHIKKPPISSAGDWICNGCHNVNFARRIDCNICSMPKPYTEILKTPISQIGPQGLFKDTDWQCFNCRNVNFQRRQNCNKCNEPKPEEYIKREQQMKQQRKSSAKPKNPGNNARSGVASKRTGKKPLLKIK